MYVGPVSLSLCLLSLALSLSVFDDSNQGAYVALFWSVAECQGPMYTLRRCSLGSKNGKSRLYYFLGNTQSIKLFVFHLKYKLDGILF